VVAVSIAVVTAVAVKTTEIETPVEKTTNDGIVDELDGPTDHVFH